MQPLLLVTGTTLQAQNADDLIGGQSATIRRFEEPLRPSPRIGVTHSAPVAGLPDDQLARIRFPLRSVVVEGRITVPLDLEPLWKDKIGTTISLAEVRQILVAIEELFRQHDIFGAALVPRQNFSDGVLRINTFEAYLRDVVVESDDPELKARILPYTDAMKALRPLRISRLERYALLLADIPGLTVDAIVEKIEDDPAAAKLTLKIERDRHNLVARLDTLGTRATGPAQLGGIAEFNDAVGLLEGSNLLAVTNPADPEKLALLRFGQHYPLGPSGFSTGYLLGGIRSVLRHEDIRARTLFGDVYLRFAALRQQNANLFLEGSLHFKDIHVDDNEAALIRDQIQWLEATARLDVTSRRFTGIGEIGWTLGEGPLSPPDSRKSFSHVHAEARFSYELADDYSLQLNAAGRYALEPLPPAVRLELGGESFGRGFESGAASGDHGLALSLELHHSIASPVDWIPHLDVFGFIDYGALWNPPGDEYEFLALGSYGLGMQAALGKNVNLSAFVAAPYRTPADIDVTHKHFGLAAAIQF